MLISHGAFLHFKMLFSGCQAQLPCLACLGLKPSGVLGPFGLFSFPFEQGLWFLGGVVTSRMLHAVEKQLSPHRQCLSKAGPGPAEQTRKPAGQGFPELSCVPWCTLHTPVLAQAGFLKCSSNSGLVASSHLMSFNGFLWDRFLRSFSNFVFVQCHL